MPVIWVVNPVTAEWTSKTSRDKRTGTTVYIARASEPSTPAAAELAGTPILNIGQNYPGEGGYFPCVDRDAQPMDQTRMLFKVTCNFDSSAGGLDENPLAMPLRVTYNPKDAEETYFLDESVPERKRAIMTSGEPFAELPKRDGGVLVIALERNVAASTNYSAYEGFTTPKVNSANVTIDGRTYAAGTLKTSAPQLSDIKEQNGIQYRTLSVTLTAKNDGWDQKYESRGLYAYAQDSGKLQRIMVDGEDGGREPVEAAWPLDADGFALEDPAGTGAEIVLKPYLPASFAAFV